MPFKRPDLKPSTLKAAEEPKTTVWAEEAAGGFCGGAAGADEEAEDGMFGGIPLIGMAAATSVAALNSGTAGVLCNGTAALPPGGGNGRFGGKGLLGMGGAALPGLPRLPDLDRDRLGDLLSRLRRRDLERLDFESVVVSMTGTSFMAPEPSG